MSNGPRTIHYGNGARDSGIRLQARLKGPLYLYDQQNQHPLITTWHAIRSMILGVSSAQRLLQPRFYLLPVPLRVMPYDCAVLRIPPADQTNRIRLSAVLRRGLC